MFKNTLVLLIIGLVGSSALAGTHVVKYVTDARGGKGVFTTKFTNPMTWKEETKVTNGHDENTFYDVDLKKGDKLRVEQTLDDQSQKTTNACNIYLDHKSVATKISYPNKCVVEYTVK